MKKIIVLSFLTLSVYCSLTEAGKQGTIVWGAKLTTPQLFSVSATTYPYHLWMVQAEPGIGGGKLNIGLGGNWEYTFGIAMKAVLLRTWLYPIGGLEENQTYAGAELEMMWKGVNLSLGILGHIAGKDPSRDMVMTIGLGIGF